MPDSQGINEDVVPEATEDTPADATPAPDDTPAEEPGRKVPIEAMFAERNQAKAARKTVESQAAEITALRQQLEQGDATPTTPVPAVEPVAPAYEPVDPMVDPGAAMAQMEARNRVEIDQLRRELIEVSTATSEQQEQQRFAEMVGQFDVADHENSAIREHFINACIKIWDNDAPEGRLAKMTETAKDFEQFANQALTQEEGTPAPAGVSAPAPPPAGSSGEIASLNTPVEPMYSDKHSIDEIIAIAEEEGGKIVENWVGQQNARAR